MDGQPNVIKIPKPPRSLKWKTIFLAVFAVLFVGASGAAYYFYDQYTAALQRIPKTPEEEVREILARVSMHILLPDEEPTLATVTDIEALRGRPFFANAKTGSKVLIFPEAQKAILYDPFADRIIEVAPFISGGFGVQQEPGEVFSPGEMSTGTETNSER